MSYKIEHTNRGFALVKFADANGKACSLQKSSLATDDCVWLGCDDIELKHFTPGIGWSDVPLTDNHIANTRMHLSRETVAALLPLLQRFIETGELEEPGVRS